MDTKSQGIFFSVPGKRTMDMMFMLYIKQEDGTVVRHVPREFSKTFCFYMKRGGQVTAQVTEKYGNKGHGLEIPAVYIFAGCAKDTMKLLTSQIFSQFCGVLSLVHKIMNKKTNKQKKEKEICNVLDVLYVFDNWNCN